MSSPSKNKESKRQVVAQNRRARFDYQLIEKFEAGIVLVGPEVKSIRAGKCSIAEAFARIQNHEVWILGMFIPEYFEASYNNHVPLRTRKLLLNKKEILRLERGVDKKGMTIVPSELWLSERGHVKLTLWLAQGKKDWDKRESIKKREMDRDMKRY